MPYFCLGCEKEFNGGFTERQTVKCPTCDYPALFYKKESSQNFSQQQFNKQHQTINIYPDSSQNSSIQNRRKNGICDVNHGGVVGRFRSGIKGAAREDNQGIASDLYGLCGNSFLLLSNESIAYFMAFLFNLLDSTTNPFLHCSLPEGVYYKKPGIVKTYRTIDALSALSTSTCFGVAFNRTLENDEITKTTFLTYAAYSAFINDVMNLIFFLLDRMYGICGVYMVGQDYSSSNQCCSATFQSLMLSSRSLLALLSTMNICVAMPGGEKEWNCDDPMLTNVLIVGLSIILLLSTIKLADSKNFANIQKFKYRYFIIEFPYWLFQNIANSKFMKFMKSNSISKRAGRQIASLNPVTSYQYRINNF